MEVGDEEEKEGKKEGRKERMQEQRKGRRTKRWQRGRGTELRIGTFRSLMQKESSLILFVSTFFLK